jgi:hypothetical protein
MAVKILNDSSFGLIRTNPKLSTNIKLIIDSNDNLYLESFNANKELSNSKFKAFKVDPNSNYSRDLFSFYNNGKFPAELAYQVFQKNTDLSVLSEFSAQYEGSYTAGTKIIDSKFYDEELSMFAPMWLNGNLPKYFIILKVDGAVNVNNYNSETENAGLNNAISPSKFKQNILDNSTIIKTFDLGENTNIGKYIRNHYKNDNFPASPLEISFRKDELSNWCGISYTNGVMSKRGEIIFEEFITKDKSIIENEYFFTKGFEKHRMICANLLNLQFLFNDNTTEDYKFNRYFGLYVDEIPEGTFKLDSLKFYKNKDSNQVPNLNKVFDQETINSDLKLANKKGVKVFAKEVDTDYKFPEYNTIKNLNSIFYIKNKLNSFYKINVDIPWNNNELILSDKEINIKDLAGLDFNQKTYIPATILSSNGYSSYTITINSTDIPQAYNINFYDNLTYNFQVACDSSLTLIGDNNYQYFSNKGTLNDVAESIAKAINYSSANKFYYQAVAQDNKVIIRSRVAGDKFNKLNIDPDNISSSIIEYEDDTYFLKGGTITNNRVKVSSEFISLINIGDYIESSVGYNKVINIVKNTDEPIFSSTNAIESFSNSDDYVVVLESNDIKVDTLGKIAVYKVYEIPFGRFSIFPLKDFDFDFFSTEYSDLNELQSEINEYNTYLQSTGNELIPYAKTSHPDVFDFYADGFGKLQPILQPDSDSGAPARILTNEYDRLNENYTRELCNVSRIIPFINKWVYKDGKDTRNNDYRLNSSSAFGIYNFSPSKDEFKADANSYTHEWYYLSKIPNYFDLVDLKNSWSYFNNTINDNLNPIFGNFELGTFQDITTDNFTNYFIVDNLEHNGTTISLDKQVRYTKFSGGDTNRFAETFFRGVKVIIKDRAENTKEVNFNTNNIKCNANNRFNGYKFAAILVPNQEDKPSVEIKVIRNRKWKTITLVIFTKVDYEYFDNGEDFIDRTMLYSLKSNIIPGVDGFSELPGGGYDYANIEIDGAINFQKGSFSGGVYTIKGDADINGISPKFLRDIKVGPNGKYNRIEFSTLGGVNNFVIDDILEIRADDTIIANTFTKNGAPILALPTLSIPRVQWGKATYTAVDGGYKILENIFNEVSFASIYQKINNGDPNIIYEDVDESGNITYNTFLLELRTGDLILKSEYITTISDEEKPVQFNLIDTIGYRISLNPNAKVIPFYRHSGKYTPKFREVFKFVDPYIIGIDTQGLTEYEENIKELCRFKNTQFNIEDSDFGIVKNLFYHKVNSINPGSILELSSDNAFNSRYPLINEFGIDKKDQYLFTSNWDPGFFIENISKDTINYNIGTKDMKEEQFFYSNKYLKVPNTIQLEKFNIDTFDINLLDNKDDLINSVLYQEFNNKVDLYCFSKLELVDFIYNKSYNEFEKYINPEFGVGSVSSIEDDIKEYINLNIVQLYTIDSIDLYVKETRGVADTKFTYINSSNFTKIDNGLALTKTFSIEPLDSSNFNFKLIYNKNIGFNYNIAISIKLIKK